MVWRCQSIVVNWVLLIHAHVEIISEVDVLCIMNSSFRHLPALLVTSQTGRLVLQQAKLAWGLYTFMLLLIPSFIDMSGCFGFLFFQIIPYKLVCFSECWSQVVTITQDSALCSRECSHIFGIQGCFRHWCRFVGQAPVGSLLTIGRFDQKMYPWESRV